MQPTTYWIIIAILSALLVILLLVVIICAVVMVVIKATKKNKNKKNMVQSTVPLNGTLGERRGQSRTSFEGDEATTVLTQKKTAAMLKRISNDQAVLITRTDFKIGKERKNVDFCISDNSAISRIHASIVIRGEDFFIVDQRSTNFTFVNGKRISAGREIPLHNGDQIVLADEEFIFTIS